jgi:hypothetical protein
MLEPGHIKVQSLGYIPPKVVDVVKKLKASLLTLKTSLCVSVSPSLK